jgi:Leucine-rich repeat (LRR) protein
MHSKLQSMQRTSAGRLAAKKFGETSEKVPIHSGVRSVDDRYRTSESELDWRRPSVTIMSMKSGDVPKDKALDSQLALSLIGRDAPHDLIVNRDFVTRIGNLCDVAFIRKLNISFNQIRTLDGIDQLPQLKQLLAYACGIDKIECLKAISKIESVLLQQNKIPRMADTFTGMSKLQELRLDQNRISKIEGLSGCVSLRKLDVSFNNIEKLEGISGLQQLQELKASNNAIKTLLPLKALPSIKDLDVSNNQLKNLDGLHQLPTLEYVKADHNMIAELRLLPMLGASKKPTVGAAAETVSKEKTAGDKKATGANASAAAKKDKGALAEVAELSGPMLLELSVSGNRIRSVQGLEVYKLSLETLDLSSNNLSGAEMSDLAQALKPCRALSELRLHLNPICDDDRAMDTLVAELSMSCPSLRAIDGLAIVNSDAFSKKSAYSGHSSVQPGAYAAARNRLGGDASSLASGSTAAFHTWNDDATSVGAQDADTATIKDEQTEKDDLSDASDSENEKENGPKDAAGNPDAKRYPPNLTLQEMLTPEQILAKEAEIRNGLRYCKDRLEKAARTVFGFVDEEPAEPVTFKAKRLLPQPVQSASGARVAAKLDEAEALSRKQSVADVPVAETTAAPGAGAPPERVSAKEKLVDRVRLAVSSSAAASGTSPQNPAAAQAPAQSTTTQRPRTAESLHSTAGPVPNNPLLTDEIAASFRMHREALAKETGAHNTEPTSPLRPSAAEPGAAASALSPGSQADGKSVQSGHSKGAKSSAAYLGPVSTLGSGLTRYGTKIKSAPSEAKSNDAMLRSNISILRAAGAHVESLDVLNLHITKPAQHVYMTEWSEDDLARAEGKNDSDGESDGSGREDADSVGYDDQNGYEDVALEAVAEEAEDYDGHDHDGDADAVEGNQERGEDKAQQEVLFHEVRTRPDDRFGRALAGVGGGGYDPRAVRRGTVDELTQATGINGSEQTPLRRGHSAPNMESASLDLAGQRSSVQPSRYCCVFCIPGCVPTAVLRRLIEDNTVVVHAFNSLAPMQVVIFI